MNQKKFFVISIITLFCVIIFSVFCLLDFIEFMNECNELINQTKSYKIYEDTKQKDTSIIEKEVDNNAVPKNELEKTKTISMKSLGEFRLTAYCSCEKCCGYWATVRPVDENGNEIVYGSSGEVLTVGRSVAVDTSVIPHGSELVIGDKKYIAHDTGSGIYGNCIDVYCDDHQEAIEFGVQYKEVFLIGG